MQIFLSEKCKRACMLAVHECWIAQDSSRKQCHRQISGALAGFQDYNMIKACSQGWNMLEAEMWLSWAALKKKQIKKNSPTIWQMWKNIFKLPSLFLYDTILVMNRGTGARIMWQNHAENLGWSSRVAQCGSVWCSVPLRYTHISSTLQ